MNDPKVSPRQWEGWVAAEMRDEATAAQIARLEADPARWLATLHGMIQATQQRLDTSWQKDAQGIALNDDENEWRRRAEGFLAHCQKKAVSVDELRHDRTRHLEDQIGVVLDLLRNSNMPASQALAKVETALTAALQ